MSVRLTVISSKLVVVRMRWKANYIDVGPVSHLCVVCESTPFLLFNKFVIVVRGFVFFLNAFIPTLQS